MGAYAVLAKYGRDKIAEAARAASPSSDDYWLAKVDALDPDRRLSDADRRDRATDMKRGYFAALAYKSAKARKRPSRRAV